MHVDVRELREFYARPLGVVVRRLLVTRIRARWSNVRGEVVIGLGFATPFLGAFRGEAAVLGALMPVGQGVLAWPPGGPYQSAGVDEDALPLPDASVDKIIAVHGIEGADNVRAMLREIWRVLRPEGLLLLIVPNRRGAWARRDSTPFGQGRPYSRGQLERLLKNSMLGPVEWMPSLYLPPIESGVLMRNAVGIERLGSRLWPAFAGVVMVEARKEMIAPVGKAERASVREFGPFRTAPAARLSSKAARGEPPAG
jgi:SAM-dependent methyltransferase